MLAQQMAKVRRHRKCCTNLTRSLRQHARARMVDCIYEVFNYLEVVAWSSQLS